MSRRLVVRLHAARRMIQRSVRMEEVEKAIAEGDTIESYPDDSPFPSRLVLGWTESGPLHVVVADDTDSEVTYVITVYRPETEQWDEGFRRRRS